MPEYEDMGTQFDGEPAAVITEPVPTPEPTPETPEQPETPEPEAAEAPEEEEKPHKKSGSQRWKEKAERAKEEAEHWRQVALGSKPAEAPKPSGEPALEQFETHAEWVKAVVKWDREEADRQASNKKALDAWEQKKEVARAKFEDFDDALDSADAPNPGVASILMESPVGGELAYHLASHPDEYRRINQLAPPAAALAVARLEAQLSAPKPTPKKTTQAPPPITPVTPSAATPAVSLHGRFDEF